MSITLNSDSSFCDFVLYVYFLLLLVRVFWVLYIFHFIGRKIWVVVSCVRGRLY
jgi:hypothetical protein